MNEMKWFEMKFRGRPEYAYAYANSIQEALSISEHVNDVSGTLDYYNEISVLPFNVKPIYISKLGEPLHEISRDDYECKQILPKLAMHDHNHEINVNIDVELKGIHYSILAKICSAKIELTVLI